MIHGDRKSAAAISGRSVVADTHARAPAGCDFTRERSVHLTRNPARNAAFLFRRRERERGGATRDGPRPETGAPVSTARLGGEGGGGLFRERSAVNADSQRAITPFLIAREA